MSSPKPPDPVATAAAQSGTNRDTAIAGQLLNMTNQVGPDGTLTYNQTGNNSYVDSLTGKTVTLPSYTATTSLSAGQQAIKDQTDAASLNLGKLANQQSAAISDQLSKPFSYSPFGYTGSDAENMAYDLGNKRLAPQLAQDQDTLRTQLIASGLRPGTAQYDQQMTKFNQSKNDAYDQLTLGAQQQGYNQALSSYQQNFNGALTQYNEPLNSISALMSGSQIASPTTGFASTPSTQVAGTDYSGLVNQQYQSKVQSANATNGALGGLFGTALSF